MLLEASDAAVESVAGLSALFFGGFALLWIAIMLFVLVSFVVTLWGLYHILTAKNPSDWKLLWAVVIVFLGLLGVVIYYFIGRKERKI